jgi:hypothetical protein
VIWHIPLMRVVFLPLRDLAQNTSKAIVRPWNHSPWNVENNKTWTARLLKKIAICCDFWYESSQ